jgi:dihydroorotate dehydrogenase (fumarate)
MVDLTTEYLGLELRSPLVASAGPSTGDLDRLRALRDAGIGAVVLPSLFEEQIVREQESLTDLYATGADANPESAGGFFHELDDYNTGVFEYLRHLSDARAALDVPVIASLNGTTRGGWLRYAEMLVDAGADAIELNAYRVVADVATSGRAVEDELVDLVGVLADEVAVPVAVKLGPWFSALAHTATRLADAGAAGLVLFNRFYQPDLDLDTLDVVPELQLSTSHDALLSMRWIAMLRDRVAVDLAATSGVHTSDDVLKLLLVGADVTMMTSALLLHGPQHVADVERGVVTWMEQRRYRSVAQLRGSMSQAAVSDPGAFERANYVRTLTSAARRFG